jgi:probable rRNA maturation factor
MTLNDKPIDVSIEVQRAIEQPNIPSDPDIQKWVEAILNVVNYKTAAELTIRIVGREESQSLNSQFRNQNKPTNVLSFESGSPDFIQEEKEEFIYLGDIIICAEIVVSEAKTQKKTEISHWAHMVVHGCLHLMGYDHIIDEEAEVMESIEIKALKVLGYDNPYL